MPNMMMPRQILSNLKLSGENWIATNSIEEDASGSETKVGQRTRKKRTASQPKKTIQRIDNQSI